MRTDTSCKCHQFRPSLHPRNAIAMADDVTIIAAPYQSPSHGTGTDAPGQGHQGTPHETSICATMDTSPYWDKQRLRPWPPRGVGYPDPPVRRTYTYQRAARSADTPTPLLHFCSHHKSTWETSMPYPRASRTMAKHNYPITSTTVLLFIANTHNVTPLRVGRRQRRKQK